MRCHFTGQRAVEYQRAPANHICAETLGGTGRQLPDAAPRTQKSK